MPVISALKRLRQEDFTFLGCIGRSYLRQTNKNPNKQKSK
jgi:hypothetical protein